MAGCYFIHWTIMSVKVLVSALGQQIIADAKQIENKETKDLVGYWLDKPRVIVYNTAEDGGVSLSFAPYCLVSDETAFSIRSEHIVAILEPRADVLVAYNALFETPEVTEDGSDTADAEGSVDLSDSTNGAVGVGTEGAPEVTVSSDGAEEVVAEVVA